MTHAFDIHLSGYLQVYFSPLPFLLPLESSNIDAAAGHSLLQPGTLRWI